MNISEELNDILEKTRDDLIKKYQLKVEEYYTHFFVALGYEWAYTDANSQQIQEANMVFTDSIKQFREALKLQDEGEKGRLKMTIIPISSNQEE